VIAGSGLNLENCSCAVCAGEQGSLRDNDGGLTVGRITPVGNLAESIWRTAEMPKISDHDKIATLG